MGMASRRAVMPATSLPTIIGKIISGSTPAVKPRWSPNVKAALTAKAEFGLTQVVHVLHHVEHGDVVGQGGHHAGRRDLTHAHGLAQGAQRLGEDLGDELDHGERARQDDGDGADDLNAFPDRGHARDDDDAGQGLPDDGGQVRW